MDIWQSSLENLDINSIIQTDSVGEFKTAGQHLIAPLSQNSGRPERTLNVGRSWKNKLARYGQIFKDKAVTRLPDPVGTHERARDPYAYPNDVLTRFSTHKASCIEELLPHRWKPASGT